MENRGRNILLTLGALFGVPITFAVFVGISYWLALQQRRSPFTEDSEWYWWATFAACIAIGASLIYATTLKPIWLRAVLAVLYIGGMVASLLVLHLYIACFSGDCF